MRGWLIAAALLAITGIARAEETPQACQTPDASLIKSRGAYTGRADLPDGEKIARYNEQVRRFNDCTRHLVDGNNDAIDRVREEANATIAKVRDAANRQIQDIQEKVKLAIAGTPAASGEANAFPDAFPGPTCRKPDENLRAAKKTSTTDQYVRQQSEYETCVRDYVALATEASRQVAVKANLEMQRLLDGGKARIAELKGVVKSGIETADSAAQARSHAVEGTILGRDDPILMARAAENPLENSKADQSLWTVVKNTPTGEGDPRPIICRAPQQLAGSQLIGPKVCRRNGVWAVLHQAHKDIGPDGLTILDLDATRAANTAACRPASSMAGDAAALATQYCN
jgi:hypothetical protein